MPHAGSLRHLFLLRVRRQLSSKQWIRWRQLIVHTESHGEKYAWKTYIPKFEYCTDNAAMIAITAHYKFLKGAFSSQSVSPQARMKI